MAAINLAMEPDEVTIIENIMTQLQQLLSMQGQPEAVIEEAMPPETPEEITEKAMTEETGDDKAETRLNNQTDVTDESMTDLKKTINQLKEMIGKKKAVQKSRTNDPVLKELRTLNQTLQSVIKTQQEQEQFNHNLMNAIGFSDEVVTKTLESEKQSVNPNKPIQGKDMALFAQELVTQIFKNLPQGQQNQIQKDNHPFNQRRYDIQEPMHNVIDYVCKANELQNRRVG